PVPRRLKLVGVVKFCWVAQHGQRTRHLLYQSFGAAQEMWQGAGVDAGGRPQLQLLNVSLDGIGPKYGQQPANVSINQTRRDPGAPQYCGKVGECKVRSSWISRRGKDQRGLHMAYRYSFGSECNMTW